MDTAPIPQTYSQWQHCIQIECGIALTRGYVAERLAALSDERREETQRFARLYGPAHLARVRAWFAQALAELDATLPAAASPIPEETRR